MSLKVIINDPSIQSPPPLPLPPEPESDSKNIIVKNPPKPKRRMFIYVLIGAILGSITLSGFGIWYLQANRLISPLGQAQQILGFKDIIKKPNRIVFGYLPYWNFKYAPQINYKNLTHLSLFGVAITTEGEIQKIEADYTEPGYRNITSSQAQDIKAKAAENDVEVSLTITSFDNETMDTVLADDQTISNLVENIALFVIQENYQGVNIDFEYIGTPPEGIKDQFSKFMVNLKKRLQRDNPDSHLSVAVYADSAINPRIWDLVELGKTVDHIIIMAYDFYRPNSKTAGPVSPLFGAPDLWSMDIISLLSKHIEQNPPQKLILGVPFYGYEWQTVDDTHQSSSIGRGVTATQKRISQLLLDKPEAVRNWNNNSLTPWIIYTDEDENIYQIYYDDVQSLSYKYDLTNQANLGGIAIWALGYEDDSNQMWQLIEDKF